MNDGVKYLFLLFFSPKYTFQNLPTQSSPPFYLKEAGDFFFLHSASSNNMSGKLWKWEPGKSYQQTCSPFIYVLGTKPWQNVLGTCSRYTSVHITSTVKCSRYRFVQICNRHNSRAAQYDVLCIHCATCEVILMCTLRADSGLRAKPRPLSTLFSVP